MTEWRKWFLAHALDDCYPAVCGRGAGERSHVDGLAHDEHRARGVVHAVIRHGSHDGSARVGG